MCRYLAHARGCFVEQTLAQSIDQHVNSWRGVESENLRNNETADDGDPEWPAQIGADASGESERDGSEDRCKGLS